MAQQSRFFGSSGGDVRQYNQLEFAEVMERLVTNGVFPDVGTQLAVTEQTPALMGVKVGIGKAWLQGYYYSNTADLNVTLTASNPSNPRIDLIILRLDVLSTRLVTVQVLTGTPSSVPVAPTLTQNSSIYEIELARVLVPANSTSIVNANITATNTLKALARNPFALGQTVIDTTGNVNNLDVTGFYYVTSATNFPPVLLSGDGFYLNIKENNITRRQVFYTPDANRSFTRFQISGVWQPWVEYQLIETPIFTTLTLLNGATVNNSRPPKYIKQGNTVHLQGEIANIASGTIIGTLPAGYRPIYPLPFRTAQVTATAGQDALITIATGGQITVTSTSGANPIALNGIIFVAEQ